MGKDGADFKILPENEKVVHLAHFGDNGEEIQTLGLLHQFCHENPHSKVLYLHDKGSTHHNWFNSKMAYYLNCFVLNLNCLKTLDTHDTCGWRVTPVPHIHYSGNIWWARCKYVNKLVDPMSYRNNQTFIEGTKALSACAGAEDSSHFAETWIGSAPIIFPADCMDASIDTNYMWGYKNFPIVDQYCQGAPGTLGRPCQTAATFTEPKLFEAAMAGMFEKGKDSPCFNTTADMIQRSQLWYGQDPATFLSWKARINMRNPNMPPEGTLIRFSDSQQVYLMSADDQLRGIPDLKTFIALGRDFSEVKVKHVNEKDRFQFGPMLPSARRR